MVLRTSCDVLRDVNNMICLQIRDTADQKGRNVARLCTHRVELSLFRALCRVSPVQGLDVKMFECLFSSRKQLEGNSQNLQLCTPEGV